MSGWIVPVKNTHYLLKTNTFYTKTESVTGGRDNVDFALYSDSGSIASIWWRFKDWEYYISRCTPGDYSLKFPLTPPTGVNMTWEITFTTEDLKIKCNALQVLHFIFNNTHRDDCTSKIKGKIATEIKFWGADTATKMFNADQVGK